METVDGSSASAAVDVPSRNSPDRQSGNPLKSPQKEWPTTALQAKLGEVGVIDYQARATEEEMRKYGLLAKSSISAGRNAGVRGDDDDF